MEEKTKKCQDRIVGLIDKYGKRRFADAMVKYYGLRSLWERKELDDIEQIITEGGL